MILAHWNRLKEEQIPFTGIEIVKNDVFYDETNQSFTITGIQSGDFILIWRTDDAGSSDWTDIFTGGTSILGASGNCDSVLGYYVSSGTSITISHQNVGDGSTFETVSYVVLRNVNSSQPLDVTPTSVINADGDNTAPDPPAITTVTADCLIIILFAQDDADNTAMTPPSGYTKIHSYTFGTSEPTHYLSYKYLTSATTENPSAFGNWTSSSRLDRMHTITLALRPA
jgi:hypothetical protein